jgi:hypothetical protein
MGDAMEGIPNFEGGEVLLSTGDVPVLRATLSSTHIDVDLEDKAFVKRIIAMRNQSAPNMPTETANADEGKAPQIGSILSAVRKVVDALCNRGITITVSYKGKRIATIGAEAHPILLQYITKTRGIAINSVLTAIKLTI